MIRKLLDALPSTHTIWGWFGDRRRLLWDAIGLNLAKTLWIWRGRPSHGVPCQSASDSGKAGETYCDYSAEWYSRQRFAAVCPHLQYSHKHSAWLCHANTEQIQSFWRPLIQRWFLFLACSWLLAACIGWLVLFTVHLRVPLWQVLLPTEWHQIVLKRGELFRLQGQAAFQAGQYRPAMSALQASLSLNPQDFDAALLYANLAWLSDPVRGDVYFSQLLDQFPSHAPDVGRAWLPKLLLRGQAEQAKALSFRMLSLDAGARHAWLHALIFTARLTNDAPLLLKAATMKHFSAATAEQAVLAAWAAAISGNSQGAQQLFETLATGSSSVFTHYQRIDGLLHLHQPAAALRALQATQGVLPSHEALHFLLRCYAEFGYSEMVEATIRASFRNIDLPHLTAITAFLVRNHSRQGLKRVLHTMLDAPATPQLQPCLSGLYLAAVLWGDQDLRPELAKLVTTKSGVTTEAIDRFDRLANAGHIQTAMASLLLPIEVAYAAQDALATQRRSSK